MSINLEAVSQTRQIYFNLHDIENASTENLTLIIEQIAELLENPLMKKEVTDRNHQKINDALSVLNAIYSSDFLNDSPNEEDLKTLLEYFQRAEARLHSGMEANGKLIQGFSLEGIDKDQLQKLMLEALENMNEEDKEDSTIIPDSIAPGPVAGSGVDKDMIIIGRLNDFIENLTDIYLKRYQDAAAATTDIYTAFSELNIAISEMISSAEVNSEENVIKMDVSALREAIAVLEDKLFTRTDIDEDDTEIGDPENGAGEVYAGEGGTDTGEGETEPEKSIADQLAAIKFPVAMEDQARELAEGAGLVLEGGPPAAEYYLAVDKSAFDNIVKAFDALTAENNQVGNDPNVIEVPSGTLQSFQTAVESVNNRVSSDNQTLIERLRSVTNQQQQTTQLFSSLMKEMFEANRGFLNKVA